MFTWPGPKLGLLPKLLGFVWHGSKPKWVGIWAPAGAWMSSVLFPEHETLLGPNLRLQSWGALPFNHHPFLESFGS